MQDGRLDHCAFGCAAQRPKQTLALTERSAEGPFRSLIEQSLPILGWVANWRPLEIFLYDWWPLARRRDLYRRLAAATLETKAYSEKVGSI